MKVYIVYQLGYTGSNELEILGVYRNIEEAKKVYREYIKDNREDFDFDYDKETPYTEELINGFCMVRLFKGGYQENWDNYLEIYIEEQEVK
ncbi:MAG: hypothetical protein ACI4VQ_04940 [Clostridia bacterium]